MEAGYVSSGALLPDQDLLDGELVIQVIEGRLTEILVEGNERIRDRFFETRLESSVQSPVRAQDITRQLLVFQRNRWIERVDATLEPTSVQGGSRLRLVVVERSPWRFSLRAANEYPESIGQFGGGFEFKQANVIGIADELSVWGEFTEGLRKVRVAAESPVSSRDTRFVAEFQYSKGEVVDSFLSELDIESRAYLVNLRLSHPFFRNEAHEIWGGLEGSWTRTKSSLLGDTFCLIEGVTDCRPTVSALRLHQEYSWRSRTAVFAARSVLSFGLDILDATSEDSNGTPDSEFVSWLAQLRWLQRASVPERWGDWLDGTLLTLRGDVQLANEPLLPSEQIAIGGPYTVRAYRRNLLVRDNALAGSAELRVPVWKDAFGRAILDLGPFYDIGHAWNERGSNSLRTISSVGLVSRFNGPTGLSVEASWGYRIRQGQDRGDGLQRDGVYIEVSWDVF